MKNKIIYMVVGVLAIVVSLLQEQGVFSFGKDQSEDTPSTISNLDARDFNTLIQAIAEQKSDVQVKGVGTVIKVLKDDTKGSQHQRFLLRIDPTKTLLVAHNIDLAPRVKNISEGDSVEFYGEYVWNNKGGVIHWTHHDPAGRHAGGWLKHNGQTYQ